MPEPTTNSSNRFVKFRQDFADLFDDYTKALIMQELLYWTRTQKDFGRFKDEEVKITELITHENLDNYEQVKELIEDFEHGWIRTTAKHLQQSMALPCSERTIARKLQELCSENYLIDRNDTSRGANGESKKYRVNLVKLATDLRRLGYQFNADWPDSIE